jgi:hypothetical protein
MAQSLARALKLQTYYALGALYKIKAYMMAQTTIKNKYTPKASYGL